VTDKIKDCPATSCVFARDVLIDTTMGCAQAITSRECRDIVGAPAGCMCDPKSSSRVFVAYDGKSTSSAPSGFVPCDASKPACATALSIVDTVWNPDMRKAAGSCFVQVGLLCGEL